MRRICIATAAFLLGACASQPVEPESMEVRVIGERGEPVISQVDGRTDNQVIEIEEGSGAHVRKDGPILYTMTSFDHRGEKLRGGDIQFEILSDSIPYSAIIEGKTEGSRITVINPQGTGAEIVVIDLLYTQAYGEPMEVTSGPKVVEGDDGGPILAEPFGRINSMSTVILRRGNGEQVTPESVPILQYSIYNSESGELVDSSWSTGPVRTPVKDFGDGLRTAIEGSTIGSRVMVLLPASDGYGDYDAIVFIDLLWTD